MSNNDRHLNDVCPIEILERIGYTDDLYSMAIHNMYVADAIQGSRYLRAYFAYPEHSLDCIVHHAIGVFYGGTMILYHGLS